MIKPSKKYDEMIEIMDADGLKTSREAWVVIASDVDSEDIQKIIKVNIDAVRQCPCDEHMGEALSSVFLSGYMCGKESRKLRDDYRSSN